MATICCSIAKIGDYLINEALFYQGWQYFKQHTDKSYSLTDCISFLVMEQLKIRTALTFDKHFVQAGFKRLP